MKPVTARRRTVALLEGRPRAALAVVCLLLSTAPAGASEERSNFAFLELGGVGLLSANYERALSPALSLRLGLGALPVNEAPSDSVVGVCMANVLVGRRRLELGAGAMVWSYTSYTGPYTPSTGWAAVPVTEVVPSGWVGYRRASGSKFFRAGVALLKIGHYVAPNPGVSVGIGF